MQPLVSRDLCIRPFRKGDGPAFVAAALESLSTVGVWMEWCHEHFMLKDAEVRIPDHRDRDFRTNVTDDSV